MNISHNDGQMQGTPNGGLLAVSNHEASQDMFNTPMDEVEEEPQGPNCFIYEGKMY